MDMYEYIYNNILCMHKYVQTHTQEHTQERIHTHAVHVCVYKQIHPHEHTHLHMHMDTHLMHIIDLWVIGRGIQYLHLIHYQLHCPLGVFPARVYVCMNMNTYDYAYVRIFPDCIYVCMCKYNHMHAYLYMRPCTRSVYHVLLPV